MKTTFQTTRNAMTLVIAAMLPLSLNLQSCVTTLRHCRNERNHRYFAFCKLQFQMRRAG
jgi:hypothetical protein